MTSEILAILTLILGLVICFAGHQLFRAYLVLAGFVLGFYAVYTLIAGTSNIDFTNTPAILGAFVAGLIIGLLAWLLYRFAVAIAGGLLGASVAWLIIQNFAVADMVALIILVVGVFLGAALAFAVVDLIIMLSTAITGANLATSALVTLVPLVLRDNSVFTGPLVVVTALILAALGFATQWGTGGRRRRVV